MKAALEGFTDEEVFAEIQARRTGAQAHDKSVKQAEFETLIASREIGGRQAGRRLLRPGAPQGHWDRPWMQPVERVVLVHRLREVVAQVGFTRFEAHAPDIEGELEMGVRRAAAGPRDDLAPGRREPGRRGLPPVPARGGRRLAGPRGRAAPRPAARGRVRQLEGGAPGQAAAVSRAALRPAALAGAPADDRVSLECGYPASSIRERIYALPRWATASCSTPAPRTPRARWAAWSRRAGASTRICARRSSWGTLLQRPGLRPARAPEPARVPVPARGRLPRLPADRRDVLRAAQRLPRPGPGGPDGRGPRRGVLRLAEAMTAALLHSPTTTCGASPRPCAPGGSSRRSALAVRRWCAGPGRRPGPGPGHGGQAGFTAAQIATLLDLLLADRAQRPRRR